MRVAGTERTNLDSPHGLRSVNCRRTGLGRRGDEDGRGFVRTTVGTYQAVIAPSPRAHLDLLGRLSRSLGRGPLRDLILKGAADEEIFSAVALADESGASASHPEVKT